MHDRIIGLYEDNAAAWDRMRGRDLHEREWLDRFVGMLPDGASVLDLGCGMGEPVARYLIQQGCDVIGVDSSPSLIALCRQRFPTGNGSSATCACGTFASARWNSRLAQLLPPQSRRPAGHVPPLRRPCLARERADVHERTGGRRSDRRMTGRAALPRQPGAGGLSNPARGNRLRSRILPRRGAGSGRTDRLDRASDEAGEGA